ncbi:MAG: hypothetical protein J6Z22_02085, partial [Lachnospiraceae bacterium]|nr:hypothetical protein [Lachnospiraceae bacterium]
MNTKGRKWFARGMAMLLSASMMASMAGCSGSGDTGNSASETVSQSEEEPREQTSSSEESSEAEPITTEPMAPAKIDDNGKPIADFDEFVNGQWRAAQAAREDVKNYSSSFDDLKKEVDSRYKDILKNMDLSTLSEEDGLYKAATLYRQILAGEDIPQRITSIKARLSKADKVKNLKGLYEIYADKENYRVDSMLNCDVAVDGNGYNSVWYDPKSNLIAINENYDGYLTGDLTDQRGQTLLACMNKFGYSEKRAREIITNAMEIDLQLSIFLKKIEKVGVRYYFYDEVMQEKEIPIPLVKILTHNEEEGWFLAQLECIDFWKEMFQEKNFSKLR